jgi:hypothetical protein
MSSFKNFFTSKKRNFNINDGSTITHGEVHPDSLVTLVYQGTHMAASTHKQIMKSLDYINKTSPETIKELLRQDKFLLESKLGSFDTTTISEGDRKELASIMISVILYDHVLNGTPLNVYSINER